MRYGSCGTNDHQCDENDRYDGMKKILLVCLIFPMFIINAYALDIENEAALEFGADRLYDVLDEEEKNISGKLSLDGDYDTSGAMARLWKNFLEKLVLELKNSVEFITALVALCLLGAFASSLCTQKTASVAVEVIACASAAAYMLGNVDGIVNQTVDAMYRLSDYSKAALPVVFTAAAAGGAVSSSAAKFAAVSFALDVLMSISQKLIVPLVYSFLAITLANAMFSNPILSAVQKLCKWAASTMMTGMTIAFTTYISMVGAIGSAVDTAAVKTARSFISGTLPVVGGMISDASAMVLSAAGVVKSCAGVFGLIAAAAICAGPFALLSVKMVLLKGVAAVADSMESGRLSMMFSGIGTAMALLLGLLGSCGIMLFISFTAGLKAVSI